jgi:NADP-dependent 3-hydroxy acid dehydrogenase YdfG
MKDLNTALVTGGGRGIGKETAILLSEKGMNIVICSRTQKEIDSVVKEIKMLGNNQIMGRKCDVSKSDEVNNLVKETLVKYGRIDVFNQQCRNNICQEISRHNRRRMGPHIGYKSERSLSIIQSNSSTNDEE